MNWHDLIIAVGAFISEILGTLSGFGSSTFFVPLASFFEAFKLVLALTALLHCFGNMSKIFLFRQNIDRNLVLRFALPSIVLTAFGAVLTNYFSAAGLEKSLGIFLIIFSISKIFFNKSISKISDKSSVILVGLSGFLTGFVGTGGAVRGVALSALSLSKDSFVVLSSAIDFGGDLIRAGIYLKNGYMDWHQWFYIPLMLVAGILGSYLGKIILKKINQTQFEKGVGFFVLLAGIAMVFNK